MAAERLGTLSLQNYLLYLNCPRLQLTETLCPDESPLPEKVQICYLGRGTDQAANSTVMCNKKIHVYVALIVILMLSCQNI